MQYFDLRRQESGRSSVWLERYVRDVEVAGSNPVAPTIYFVLCNPVIHDWIFLYLDFTLNPSLFHTIRFSLSLKFPAVDRFSI